MKKIAIAYSKLDEASKNIFSELEKISCPNWAKIYGFEEDSIFLPLEKISENDVIVLSKHQSQAGKKSLTTHSIGNFSTAKFGGKEKMLCGTLPKISTNILRGLNKKNTMLDEKFLVCYEVTHHGPYTNKNVVFIELGSSEKEWANKNYAKLIAETIVDSVEQKNNDEIVIGLGGNHYTPDFTKLALRKNFSFGHICPNYQLEFLDSNLLNQMITKSKATKIVLDWKGLKQFKERIVELCKETNLEFERVQRLLK